MALHMYYVNRHQNMLNFHQVSVNLKNTNDVLIISLQKPKYPYP